MEKQRFDKRKYDIEFHKNNYDRLSIVVPKGIKDKLKAYCAENNTTINGFVNDYIKSLDL